MAETSLAGKGGAFFAVNKRYLILAEGRSSDPHYGKTARGVMRYVPEQVVAVLDTQRVGETEQGFPIAQSEPTVRTT